MATDTGKITLRIEATDAYSAVIKRAEADIQKLADSSQAAGDRFSKSFGALNIRSALDINKEKANIVASFEAIKNSGVASGNEIRRAGDAMKGKLAELDKELRGVQSSAESSTKGLGSLLGSLGPLAAALATVSLVEFAKNTIEAAIKMQALDVQFKTITGSSRAAGAELKWVREQSDRLGLVFVDAADAYAKFAASAKGTALEGEGVKKVFMGVVEAVTAMHLPADSAQRIMFQLQQMMSKNKVTAEDLNVVAESLPGTYSALATSMGLTTRELQQQMQNGTVLASDVLPKLAEQLHSMYGGAAAAGANSVQAQMNRFKNDILETAARIGQTLLPAIGFFVDGLSSAMSTMRAFLDILGPGAPVAVAFAVAIGAVVLAQKALTAEILTQTAAMALNPLFLLVLAGTGAVIGVAAAIEQVAKAMGLIDDTDPDAITKKLAAEQKFAAEKKRLLDEYEAAVGVSQQRQLEKQEVIYSKNIKAVHDYYDSEIEAAGGNQAKIALLKKQESEAANKVMREDAEAREKIRTAEIEAERKWQDSRLKLEIDFAKATGNTALQQSDEYKKALNDRLTSINAYYNAVLDKAKGDVVATLAIEQARDRAVEEARRKASENAKLAGLDRARGELESLKSSQETEIKLIEAQVAKKVISEGEGDRKILAITIDSARQMYENRLSYYNQVASLYGKESEEGKKAFKELEAAHSAYIGKSLEEYKRYAQQIRQIDQEIKDFRASIQDKIRDIQQKGMTDSQKYADNLNRVNESKSKAAALMAAKNYDAAQKEIEHGIALAERLTEKKVDGLSEYEKAYADHQKKLKEIESQSGDTGKITDQQKKALDINKENAEWAEKSLTLSKEKAAVDQSIATTRQQLNDFEQLGVQNMEAKKQESQDALAKLKEMQDLTLNDKNLRVVFDQDALNRVNEEIFKLTATATKVVNVVYNSGSKTMSDSDLAAAAASYVPGMATGGWVGGAGTGDTQLRMLDPREFVLRPEAAGMLPNSFLAALNNPRVSLADAVARHLPQVDLRGPSSAARPDVTPMGSIELNIGGGSYTMQAPINVLSELDTALRRQRMCHPQ